MKEVIENRQALSAKCTSDWDVLQAAWKARTPQMEELKVPVARACLTGTYSGGGGGGGVVLDFPEFRGRCVPE